MYLCESVCVYVCDSVRVSAAGTGLVCSHGVAQARACVCGGDVTLCQSVPVFKLRKTVSVRACVRVLVCVSVCVCVCVCVCE